MNEIEKSAFSKVPPDACVDADRDAREAHVREQRDRESQDALLSNADFSVAGIPARTLPTSSGSTPSSTAKASASASPYCANLSDFKCPLGTDFGSLPRSFRRFAERLCARRGNLPAPSRSRQQQSPCAQ
nr:hypothetical protein [Afipia sp. Root123D2]